MWSLLKKVENKNVKLEIKEFEVFDANSTTLSNVSTFNIPNYRLISRNIVDIN